MSLADQMMSGMPDLDRLQSFGRGCANAAVDPECIARQQEAVWRDHLARVAWLRSMAIHDIRRQPFFR